MKKDKHIAVDLDFLDKNEIDTTNIRTNNETPKAPKKYNWKNILIVGGGILLLIGLFSSGDSSSTDDTVSVGNYLCTEYHSSQAESLSPKVTEQEIESERNSLNSRSDQLDSIKSEMDNMGVTEYSSQYAINKFNNLVEEYNSKLAPYKRDVTSFQAKVDSYNEKIQAYNDYLEKNCTKK